MTRSRTDSPTAPQVITSLFSLPLGPMFVAGCSGEASLRVLGDDSAGRARVVIDGAQAGQLTDTSPPNAFGSPYLDMKVTQGDHRVLVISSAGESLSCRTSRDTHIVLVSFARHDITPSASGD